MNIANFSVLLLFLKKVPGTGAFSFLPFDNCISGILYLQFEEKIYLSTRHVFVKHGCPRRQQSQNMAKSLSPKF